MKTYMSSRQKKSILELQDETVSTLRHDFPEATRSLTIVNVEQPAGVEAVLQWCRETPPEMRALLGINDAGEKGAVLLAQLLLASARDGEDGHSIHDIVSGRGLIRLGFTTPPMYSASPADSMKGTIHHEAGHYIVPLGATRSRAEMEAINSAPPILAEFTAALLNSKTQQETAADVFTVPGGYAGKFMDRHGAEDMSLFRAENFLLGGDFLHITTPALDRLMAEKTDAELLALARHPEERVATAQRHAAEAAAIDTPRLVFSLLALSCSPFWPQASASKEERALFFASVCDNAGEGSPLYHLTARVMTAALDRPDRVNFNTDDKRPLSGKFWNSVRGMLTEKARGTGLERYLAPRISP